MSRFLIGAGAAVAAIYFLSKKEKKAKKIVSDTKPDQNIPEDFGVLEGVYNEPGIKIFDVQPIVDDISPQLNTDEVTNIINTRVYLTPSAATKTYSTGLEAIKESGFSMEDPLSKDALTQQILTVAIAPKADWSQGLGPYYPDSPHQKVWTSVGDILKIADLNLTMGG